MPRGNTRAAAATGEGAVKQAWWPTHLMRRAGPLERKSSIIQRGVEKVGEEEEAIEGETYCRGLKGKRKRKSVDCSQVKKHQSSPVLLILHTDVKCASEHLVGVPVFTWQRCIKIYHAVFPGKLLSRASLWNNSFTLPATIRGTASLHYRHKQWNYTLMKTAGIHSAPQCSVHNILQNICCVIFLR